MLGQRNRLIVVLFSLLVVTTSSGCEHAPRPNLAVHVFNQSSVGGTFTYQLSSGGGPSGTDPVFGTAAISGCSEYATAFGPLLVEMTISSPSASLTVSPGASPDVFAVEGYVIRPDGRVELLYRVEAWTPTPSPPPLCGQ